MGEEGKIEKIEKLKIDTTKPETREIGNEEAEISFRLGENFGIFIQGHPYLKSDYEFCKVQLLDKNVRSFLS